MLVNNAAVVGKRAPFSEITDEHWRDAVQTNLMAVVSVTRAMLPLLGRGAPATIVNIGSIMGRFGRAGWSPYATTKFALEGLTQVLAQELFRSGIRVVALHPARINTNLRRAAYGEEELFPSEHLTALLDAVDWILDHPLEPISGLTLSTDDFSLWSGDGR